MVAKYRFTIAKNKFAMEGSRQIAITKKINPIPAGGNKTIASTLLDVVLLVARPYQYRGISNKTLYFDCRAQRCITLVTPATRAQYHITCERRRIIRQICIRTVIATIRTIVFRVRSAFSSRTLERHRRDTPHSPYPRARETFSGLRQVHPLGNYPTNTKATPQQDSTPEC